MPEVAQTLGVHPVQEAKKATKRLRKVKKLEATLPLNYNAPKKAW
jgi:hypothetical protein